MILSEQPENNSIFSDNYKNKFKNIKDTWDFILLFAYILFTFHFL